MPMVRAIRGASVVPSAGTSGALIREVSQSPARGCPVGATTLTDWFVVGSRTGRPTIQASPHDGIERGMLFHFINANIENQYEFVLRQWVNDSEFAGAVRLHPESKDPLDRHPESSRKHFRHTTGGRGYRRSRSRISRVSRRPKPSRTSSFRVSRPSSSSPTSESAETRRPRSHRGAESLRCGHTPFSCHLANGSRRTPFSPGTVRRPVGERLMVDLGRSVGDLVHATPTPTVPIPGRDVFHSIRADD